MPVRMREVSAVLGLVAALLVAKHIPVLDSLPLTSVTGIVCFAFAIFLCLRIFRAELERVRAEE
ncbi:MAG: hypothetical protein ABI697_07435 [Devosia sp.]